MRLRFSIRDLLWLTALVAVLVAWWVDRRHFAGLNRYTVVTVEAETGQAVVMKDNETGDYLYLVRKGTWLEER